MSRILYTTLPGGYDLPTIRALLTATFYPRLEDCGVTEDNANLWLRLSDTHAGDQIVFNAVVAGSAGQIASSTYGHGLGLISSGEFRAGNGQAPGSGFSGTRMGWPAFTYAGRTWTLVGVNADVLQFGLDALTGRAVAGAGAIVLDGDGLKVLASAGVVGPYSLKWMNREERLGDFYCVFDGSLTEIFLDTNSTLGYDNTLYLHAISVTGKTSTIKLGADSGTTTPYIEITSNDTTPISQVRINAGVTRIDGALFPLVSNRLALPALRGLWNMHAGYNGSSATQEVIDLSGQARHLTLVNTPTFGVQQVTGMPEVPYAAFASASSQYLKRTDEAAFGITGALTMMGWFYTDGSANERLMGQWLPAGNLRAHMLSVNASPLLEFIVSSDGTATTAVTAIAPAASTWYHVVGRYTPSSELAIFVNGVKYTNTTSIPASIKDSTGDFTIGAQATPSTYLNGRAALCSLHAAALTDAAIEACFTQERGLFAV